MKIFPLRPIVVEILFSFSFKKKKDWNGKRGGDDEMKWDVARPDNNKLHLLLNAFSDKYKNRWG